MVLLTISKSSVFSEMFKNAQEKLSKRKNEYCWEIIMGFRIYMKQFSVTGKLNNFQFNCDNTGPFES